MSEENRWSFGPLEEKRQSLNYVQHSDLHVVLWYRLLDHLRFYTLNLLCWKLTAECWWISSISYGFRDKLNWDGPTKVEFQDFNCPVCHPILMQFSARWSSLWVIGGPKKKTISSFYFEKGHKLQNYVYLKGIYIQNLKE